MQWWVPISVAFIGGPIMWFLARFDKNNTKQHGDNMNVLTRIESKVDKIDERVDNHIQWHLHDHRDD
jgi:hypothetical protein